MNSSFFPLSISSLLKKYVLLAWFNGIFKNKEIDLGYFIKYYQCCHSNASLSLKYSSHRKAPETFYAKSKDWVAYPKFKMCVWPC